MTEYQLIFALDFAKKKIILGFSMLTRLPMSHSEKL